MNTLDCRDNRIPGQTAPSSQTYELTRDDMERCVARARQMRAEYIRTWVRNVARSWRSVFRRPGRLLPANLAAREPVSHSA